ncbi:MAG: VOC family protein [Pseudomonadota bacterium]|nr:VOC family protein [Pseudomonadota bacterium]
MIDRFHHLVISAEDFDASLGFYRDVLGWSVTDTWGGNGADRGAILSGGGVKVVIAQRPAPGNAAETLKPNVHLDIHDVDARFRRMPKGEHVVTQPEATQWGTRWFVVRDPDGNLIAFEEVHSRGS